jgi:hypothetical protein
MIRGDPEASPLIPLFSRTPGFAELMSGVGTTASQRIRAPHFQVSGSELCPPEGNLPSITVP